MRQEEPEYTQRRPSRANVSNNLEGFGHSRNLEFKSQYHTSNATSSSQNQTNASVDETGWSPDPTQRRPTDKRREEYFSRLFNQLKFPPELAQKTLTHNSHSAARQGHNAGLAFVGRRVISAYFMMFLHSTQKLRPTDDIEDIAARSLNTHLLGEFVGNEWGVGREIVWAPSTSHRSKDGQLPGLFKIQGETVQAIMGMVFQQYGGAVAHRVFHTHLLPHVLVRGGLPLHFHEDAKRIASRMGGTTGSLLKSKAGEEKLSASA
ncbi:hypothetical protein CPB83DRAFT_548515 [Crepidotus variabilis]|uniref:RNase III domain-containing protein n=1 Tax=Crepidotus variabilis TaxID=179855 RepID=A0A9P6JLQ1_9AGAR|nr:hypothetical protein CPB83DRAFT_548515 [Crepidotus variabilis]